jgi:hypothetical protein
MAFLHAVHVFVAFGTFQAFFELLLLLFNEFKAVRKPGDQKYVLLPSFGTHHAHLLG